MKGREAFRKIRIARCGVRLLVALVARAEEGRYQVISEQLSSALKGKSEAKILVELCLGLAAGSTTQEYFKWR